MMWHTRQVQQEKYMNLGKTSCMICLEEKHAYMTKINEYAMLDKGPYKKKYADTQKGEEMRT